MALPPHQAKSDAAAEEAPSVSQKPQGDTPMEQDPPGDTGSEPNAADTSEAPNDQDAENHGKMPEHPGQDSNSDEEQADDQQSVLCGAATVDSFFNEIVFYRTI